MKFEPTYEVLYEMLIPGSSQQDATELLGRVIRNAGFEVKRDYELDEFIEICNELKNNEDRRIRTIGLSALTQAKSYRLLRDLEQLRQGIRSGNLNF
jgi:Leu/Phe-tRNA-protein transferase